MMRLYRILENPFIYTLSQLILAPGAAYFLPKYFRIIFGESGGSVLDVGCGPEFNTYLAHGHLTGVDLNPAYITKYVTDSNRQGVVASADALPFSDNKFDESRTFGLLHHLSDEVALRTVEEMLRCTRQGGRVVVIDNVWPRRSWSRPLAWLNRKLDRGHWVRREDELVTLLNKAHAGNWEMYRFTYTLIGHEALAFITRK